VANLSAANDYKADHIRHPDVWNEVETSRYFYVSGFFLTVSPDTIQYIAQHCAKTNRMFLMNLSAPFLCNFFQGPMDQASPYWDIIFGNESEAEAYAEAHNLKVANYSVLVLLWFSYTF
jgi:adenosine kinase